MEANEDAAILTFPPGKAIVQTMDFFTPIVNDPYWFGQIAAANALSDVYAMGGAPFSAMNIVCFPIKTLGRDMLREILRGGIDKINESGAILAGGHSVEDEETKYGLSVSGVVDPDSFASNKGLSPGMRLLLTKPLGTGVLATALKAKWENSAELEQTLFHWAGRLNSAGAQVIQALKLKAATDVTGFGLGGHLLEMIRGSNVTVELSLSATPFLEAAVDLAGMGLIPAGSHANKKYCESRVDIRNGLDALKVDLVFDAQTSGGLVLGVPEEQVDKAKQMLQDLGEEAWDIGGVVAPEGKAVLRLKS